MNDLKIILLCSSRFALPTLKELAYYNILEAVAIPSYCQEMIENVNGVLAGTNIPVIKTDKETFAESIREFIHERSINMGLVMTFPYKIPSSVYNIPSKGFYNIHPGPLPQYRGGDPIFQQIKNREKQAGVTIHILDESFDTGPMIIIEMLKIEPSDTYGLLTTKLADLAAKITGTLIKLFSLELAVASKLQDETKARYFKRPRANDVMINWQTMDSDSIIALINACNPWNKGAVTKINNQIIRLLDAEKLPVISYSKKAPGNILVIDENGIIISTREEGAILVKFIYAVEGFLPAYYLSRLGVVAGNQFEVI